MKKYSIGHRVKKIEQKTNYLKMNLFLIDVRIVIALRHRALILMLE